MTNLKTKNLTNLEGVQTILETITPAMAADFLSRNTNNRNLSAATVNYYKDMIVRDRWLVNGESIKISESGVLLDGQHRLEAISQSGIPVKMFVTYGVDEDAFMTIDAGRPRRHHDYLKVSGKSGNLLVMAAAARIAMGFLKDGTFSNLTKKLPPDVLIWYVETHPGIEFSVGKIGGKLSKLCSTSIAAGLRYIFSVVDEVAADDFFDSLITGENLASGSPVLALRTRLINLRGGGGHTWQKEAVHCFVVAFNHYRAGKHVTYLKYLPGFPTVLEGFAGQMSDKSFIDRE